MNRPTLRLLESSFSPNRSLRPAGPCFQLSPFALALRSAMLAFLCATVPALAQTPPAPGTVPTGGIVLNQTGVNPALIGAVTPIDAVNNSLTVTQTRPFAHITWESFNVAAGSAVIFNQAASDFVLNQVIGPPAMGAAALSQIFGSVSGPGTVALINPAGVLIGAGGVVNVGSLIASSLNLATNPTPNMGDGFDLALNFVAPPAVADATVSNLGTIGPAIGNQAQAVTLIGRGVTNGGTISTLGNGKVHLLGTDGVTLAVPAAGAVDTVVRAVPDVPLASLTPAAAVPTAGVTNSATGTIQSNSGSIILQAAVATPGLLPVVNNTGLLIATGATGITSGGDVILRGSGGPVQSSGAGSIQVAGATGGADGTITMTSDGALTANGLNAGAAGTVTLTSTGGAITGDTGNDVTGGALTANSTGGIQLDTAISSLTAAGGTGAVSIANTGFLAVNSVSVSDNSQITLSSNDVIDDDNDAAVDVTTTGLFDVNGAAVALQTSVGSLTAVGGSGGVNIANTGALTVNSVGVTGNAPITLSAGGPINGAAGNNITTTGLFDVTGVGINLRTTVGRLSAFGGAGAVNIANTGALTVNDIGVSGSSTITLSATGAINDNNDTFSDVTTMGLFDVAGVGIDLETNVGSITATGGAGAVSIANGGALVVNSITDSSTVTLSAGGAISDNGDINADVTTTGLFDVSGAGIDLDTAVATLNANGMSGTVNISNTGSVAVDTVVGSDVTLSATGGAITDVNGAGTNNIVAGALNVTAVTGINLDTNITSLDASVSGAGNLVIREASDITLTDLDTANGSITVTADGALTATRVTSANGADANDIMLTTTVGNLVAGDVSAAGAGDVTLTANAVLGQQILDDDNAGSSAATRVVGDVVTLTARGSANPNGGGIGSGFDTLVGALDTEAVTLIANVTDAGSINISEQSGVAINSLASVNGDITLAAGGALDVPAINVGATNDLSLTTTGGTSDLTLSGLLTAGNVTLDAGRAITDNLAGNNISATTLIADAATGIDLDTSIDSLDAAVGGIGNLVIREANGITLTDLDTANGNIQVEATAGNIVAGSVTALSGGDVTLTANTVATQMILDDAAGTVNGTRIAGDVVTLTAGGGIGGVANVVDTAAASLDASVTSTGSINIDEADSVTLSGVDTANGSINLIAGGTITASTVAATGGEVALDANVGNIAAGLISGTNVSLESAGAITDGNGPSPGSNTNNIVATALTATAGSGINLDTSISTLSASGGAGVVSIREAGDLAVISASTTGGNAVNLSAVGAITDGAAGTNVSTSGAFTATAGTGITLDTTVGSLSASNAIGDVAISQDGSLTVGAVSGGSVTLVATGAITDDGNDNAPVVGTTRIVGNQVTLSAANGIGGATEDLDINATTLAATTTGGPINLDELNSVTLNTLTTGNGDIALSAGGPLVLPANANANNLSFTTRDVGAALTVGGLTATNTVTLSSAGAIVDGNGVDPNVNAASLNASAASGIALNTSVDTLTANGGTGAITIVEANGITVQSAQTVGGAIDIRALAGDLTAGAISAGGGNVALSANTVATQRILDDETTDASTTRITGNRVTLSAGNGIGSDTVDVDTAATTLSASTATGTINVDELNDVTLAAFQTGNGNVALTVGADLNTGSINVGANSLSLTARGAGSDLRVGDLRGGSVTLVAGGSISENADATPDVSATTLDATAGAGIDLDTDVVSLDASVTGPGSLSIRDVGAITLRNLQTSSGGISVTAVGDIAATSVTATGGSASFGSSGGSLSVTRVSGSDVILTAAGAITGNGAGPHVSAPTGNLTATGTSITLNTDVASLNADGGAGAIDITEASGIALNSVSNTAGDIRITAAGAITGNGAGPHVSASTGNLTVTGTGITLATDVASLNADGGAGAIDITEASGIALNSVSNTAGGIRITAAGDVSASNISAGGGNALLSAGGASSDIAVGSVSGNGVTLLAGGAITDSNGANTPNVTAATLAVTATSGINLDTRVAALSGSGGNGAVVVREADAITLNNLGSAAGGVTVSTTNGTLTANTVSAGSGATVLTAGGSGNLMAVGVSGSNVTLGAGGAITGGSGLDVATPGLLTAAAVSGIDLDTNVASLNGSVSGPGSIAIREADAITLTDLDTSSGAITVSAGGTLTAQDVAAGNGAVTLATSGAGSNVAVGVVSGSSVGLNAGGAITDSNGSGVTNVTANSLTANAAAGINLDTRVATLTGSGGGAAVVVVREADAITINTLANTAGGIWVSTASGALTANNVNAGSGNVALTAGGNGGLVAGGVSGGNVTLLAGGAISGGAGGADVVTSGLLTATAASGLDLDTDIASLDASVTGVGNLTVRETSGLTILTADTANGSIGVTANTGNLLLGTVAAGSGGNVTLSANAAGGQILDDGNDLSPGTTRITGNVVTLNANAGIGTAVEDVDTAATSLSASTVTGPINIDELDAVTATTLATGNGNISLSTATGTLTAITVTAGGGDATLTAGGDLSVGSVTANTVSLAAVGAITDRNGPSTNNVSSERLIANAGTRIDLDTTATALDISSGNGVDLRVAGPVNFGIDDQIDGGNGAVSLDADGSIMQDRGRDGPAIRGSSISLFAGGSVGQLVVPIEVDASGGAVTVNFDDPAAQGFISGRFGSLNESSRVLGLSSNSVLSGAVGAIQSSFARRVTFSLDSSQFASSARIFGTEGTGVLLPEDQRE